MLPRGSYSKGGLATVEFPGGVEEAEGIGERLGRCQKAFSLSSAARQTGLPRD
jgi:hypothetical protein